MMPFTCMALRCITLAKIHMRHIDLLHGVQSLLAEPYYRRPHARVAAFVLDCRDRCRELGENNA